MTMTAARLDQLAIDTIRTLAIDGVQRANSGHPGAPMGMAPMAYVLWTRVLRYAPDRPRLARPRPLRALRRPRQHAALRAAAPDRLRPPARGAGALPPVGLADAGPPGVGPRAGCRGDHRAAGPGHRQRRGHGHRRAASGGRVQPAGPRDRRSPHVRHLLGRRPPGGHQRRGGQPGRPPAPGQADRPLRRQPASSSTGRPRWPSARTCWPASTPTAGTPSGWRTATTSRPSPPR